MVNEPGGREFQSSQPEAPKQNPTEASRGFLRRFTDKIFTDRPGLAQGLIQGIFASRGAQLAVQDFVQGNYPSAVVEGVIAGVLAISHIRFAWRVTR